MTIREEVQQLVDGLSDERLLAARCLLAGLVHEHELDGDALRARVAMCEEDDEPVTEDEMRVAEESWQAYLRGEGIPHDELMRRRRGGMDN